MIIKRPIITEKSTSSGQNACYVFEISRRAQKTEVAKAVLGLYRVKPVKVNIVNAPAKRVFTRGKSGTRSGFKKAFVYLRPGDKIEF